MPNYVNGMAADEKAKGPTGVPTIMSLGKASKPATLEERLVAGALQPSVVAKVLPCYEPRDPPEVPNHVKDMWLSRVKWGF